jgi:hypothetical protein
MAKMQFNIPEVRERAPNDVWMGFDSREGIFNLSLTERHQSGLVMPNEHVMVTSRAQLPFRGERLCVWSRCAELFIIHRVQVGVQFTMANPNPIPASPFATRMDRLVEIEKAFERDGYVVIEVNKSGAELMGLPFSLPVAFPGVDITMQVENISADPSRFLAGFLGKGIIQ